MFTKQQNFEKTKLKAFSDNKSTIAKMMISVFDRVKNILELGTKKGDLHYIY